MEKSLPSSESPGGTGAWFSLFPSLLVFFCSFLGALGARTQLQLGDERGRAGYRSAFSGKALFAKILGNFIFAHH